MTDQKIVEILAKHGIGEAWHVGVTPFPLDGEDAPLFIAAYREMLEVARSTIAAPAQPTCRDDGRCQYAIDHGAEGMGACPVGRCCEPRRDAIAAPAQEPFAYFQLNSGWDVWEQVEPTAKDRLGVIAAYRAPASTAAVRPTGATSLESMFTAIEDGLPTREGFYLVKARDGRFDVMTDLAVIEIQHDLTGWMQLTAEGWRTVDQDEDLEQRLAAAPPSTAAPVVPEGELEQLRYQNLALVAIYDEVKNLIRVKGRHNNEIAYKRLVAAFDACNS
jgi:hypothetical protein